MSRRVADLLIKIGADSYEFQQKTKQVEKGLDGLNKKLTSVGTNLSTKLSVPLMALGGMAVMAADGAMKASAKVQQAIKSTSGAAQLSFKQLNAEADKLEALTLFDGDDILNGATAQLLTFTNIAGDNFLRTQAVALDLATVLQGDLKSASIQLGKALNDPVKNLSALSRSGIQFSKEQTAVIKSLAETGRLAEAQALILDELERQYGGQAEAAAKVGAYALNELKDAWGKLMDEFGMIIIPVLNRVVGVLKDVVSWLQTLNPATLKMIVAVAGIAAAIGPVLITLGGIIKILPLLKVGILALANPITAIIGLAAMLGAAFISAFNSYKSLQNLNADLATQWVAEGKYKVGDEDMIRGFIADHQKKLEGHEKYYGKLGGWKNLNADYRGGKADMQSMIDLWQRIIVELEKKKKVEDEAAAASKKAMEDAKKQAEEMAKSIAGVNSVTTESSGLITDLQNKISALEKKKLLLGSKEEIAATNAEIGKLRDELSTLQNITPQQLNRTPLEPIATNLNLQPIVPKLEVKLPDLKPIISQAQQQMMEINDVVANGIYGWADKTSTAMMANVAETNTIVSNYTDALVAKGWEFSEALQYVSNNVSEAMRGFDSSINQFLAGSIEAAAEAIGQVIAGDLGMDGLLRAILLQLANFLKQIGSQLIKFGVMIVAFKSALKSVLANPWAAIAVGGAMVAAAAIMTALINKNAEKSVPKLAKGGLAFGSTYAMVGDNPNARIDPEVIAPLSKLQQMMGNSGGGTQNVHITLGGELTAKGRDLAYILSKENFKVSLLGG